MQKEDKERVVAELTERLRTADTLIVADYRGLTMPQIDGLRGKLLEHGARLSVVKNTLMRRASEAAGNEALLALLEGPSAIAFVETGGDAVAVAKALSESARDTRILTIRGGVMSGRQITETDVESLAKLPPVDVLRGQVIGVIIAPLTQLIGLVNAPLQNLIGLIDARIDQLEEQGDTGAPAAAPAAEAAPATDEAETPAGDEPAAEAEAAAESEATAEAEAAPAADEPEAAAPVDEPEAQTETAEPEAQAEAPAEDTTSDSEEA
jgi:large subunit ribosomal protein L10